MDEVEVDEEQIRLALGRVDYMGIPDLVGQGSGSR
jgi:hypothetical protein